MEENKKNQQPKKLTYDELNKAASELHVQYQKLLGEYQKAMQALQNRDFDYTSFFLQMLFKVMDHPKQYEDNFVKWAAANIQSTLVGFSDSFREAETKAEKGNEAGKGNGGKNAES